MSFTIVLILVLICIANVSSDGFCPNSVSCSEHEGTSQWCCPIDSYCGPNKGSCYSNKQTDQVLVIGGSVLGVIIFLVIILITYCVRKSIVEEREARRTDNGCELQVTQHRDLSSTSFSNPLANNQPNISEFEKGMNVLKNTDELLQRTRQTTEA